MPFIRVNNQTIPFQARRSLRAKRLQILVRPEFFEVIVPRKITNKQVLDFIFLQQRWLLKQWGRKPSVVSAPNSFWPENFLAGELLPLRGRQILLNVKYGKKTHIQFQENSLLVVLPHRYLVEDSLEEKIKKLIVKWYQQETLMTIQKSIDYFCAILQRWPTSIHLRQQKTRWGSCSSKGNININWLLMLAPPGVLEYVVAHELSHLFYRNHGPRFWGVVERCFSEYKLYQSWLRKHGQHLLPLT